MECKLEDLQDMPGRCLEHHMRLQAVEKFAEDVRDSTKWLTRAIGTAIILFVVNLGLGLMVVGALARSK